jgi:hypothetical protein
VLASDVIKVKRVEEMSATDWCCVPIDVIEVHVCCDSSYRISQYACSSHHDSIKNAGVYQQNRITGEAWVQSVGVRCSETIVLVEHHALDACFLQRCEAPNQAE